MSREIRPHVVRDREALSDAVRGRRAAGRRVGLVPTMGALHAGHRALMAAARDAGEAIVVSIFVNPAQFDAADDLAAYPRTFEADLAACAEEGVDVVFAPPPDAVYRGGHETWVEVGGVSADLEGAYRPGHFRGVATVVLKLLNMAAADRAYFGRKDFQQLKLIERLVADLDVPVEIVPVETVREADGLALSSRNVRLDSDARRRALSLSRVLNEARGTLLDGEADIAAVEAGMLAGLRDAGAAADYAVVRDADTLTPLDRPAPRMVALVAATVGGVRLIDNVSVERA
ncbi:MAG: pantoate--beta-alanine ligase [Planctomycetota bacterium]